jgi:hypothetical protein
LNISVGLSSTDNVTKFIAMIAINLVIPKAAAKPYPLLNWGTRKLMGYR